MHQPRGKTCLLKSSLFLNLFSFQFYASWNFISPLITSIFSHFYFWVINSMVLQHFGAWTLLKMWSTITLSQKNMHIWHTLWYRKHKRGCFVFLQRMLLILTHKRFCFPLLFQSEGGGSPCYILSLCVYLPFFLLTNGPILAITLGYLHYFGRESYFFSYILTSCKYNNNELQRKKDL